MGHVVIGMTVALFVTFEELSQLFFKGRTFSLDDLAASYLGICCFGLLSWWIKHNYDNKAAGKNYPATDDGRPA